jgi:aspartate/glutamate/glutamine transport system substrate-binding protein
MKKIISRLGLLLTLLLMVVTLSACSSAASQKNVLQEDKQTKTITWGVKADTKLFGLMDVKDNQIKGFEIDLAKAMTKQILGKTARPVLSKLPVKPGCHYLETGTLMPLWQR